MKKILGIILARGGSKGIKDKNIVKFGNKPLIKWTFDTAKKSKKISRLILSTDSKKIASIAKKNKIEVPFLRPKKFAGDNSKSIDAIEHAINFFKKQKVYFDYIVLLEPTSPLRTTIDINKSIDLIIRNKADSLVSICKVDEINPSFLFKKKNKKLQPLEKKISNHLRRQDVEPIYFLEGTIYISKTDVLFKKRSFCNSNTIGFEVPKWKSLEIDDKYDLEIGNSILKQRKIK
jgi:N-acylneuraminate cytidylyltransferase/CMP-N,N'-diacetyllegionaminic acid synthase